MAAHQELFKENLKIIVMGVVAQVIREVSKEVKLQALVYNILPSTTAYLVRPSGPENCQLTSSVLLVLRQ